MERPFCFNFILMFRILIVFFIGLSVMQGQSLKEYAKIDDFYSRISNESDTTYVVNFWATWCAPCVKELPHFFKVEKEMKDRPYRFIFLSLDFKKEIEKRVIPFIRKNNITSEMGILTDTDANHYINFIHQEWDGAIPATMIYHKKQKRKFTQDEFSDAEELKNFIVN